MATLKQKTVNGTTLELKEYSDGRYEVHEDGSRIIEPFDNEDDAWRYFQNTVADFRRRANENSGGLPGMGGGGGMPGLGGGGGGQPSFPGMMGGGQSDDDDDDDSGPFIPGL